MPEALFFLPPMPETRLRAWLHDMRNLLIEHLQSWLPLQKLELSVYQPGEWEKELTEFFALLLAQAPGCLPDIMYRIDVNEEKFKLLLRHLPPGSVANHTARLILQREAEKTAWRMLYAVNKFNN